MPAITPDQDWYIYDDMNADVPGLSMPFRPLGLGEGPLVNRQLMQQAYFFLLERIS